MNIITVGINHKNTPIEIREQLFLNPTQQDLLLSELKSNPAILEACVLSTCNRVEIYAQVLDKGIDVNTLTQLIFQIKKVLFTDDIKKYFYTYYDDEAIYHLLEVSSGLDSLVIGEEQILGQVKAAFERARELGMFGRYFNVLSNIVVRAGKKARNETNINFGGSSVSWAAIVKAEEVLGNLKDRSILVIGAGIMSELAVGHIQNKEFKKLYLMNRTQEHAKNLSKKYGGEVIAFCDMKEILSQVDICICSAGAPHYLLEKDVVERVMDLRNNKKLVFIDISMPRNIDPLVGEVNNVLLYQIDDLKEVVDSNIKLREQAAVEVRAIIEEKLAQYYRKIKKLPQFEQVNASKPFETLEHLS